MRERERERERDEALITVNLLSTTNTGGCKIGERESLPNIIICVCVFGDLVSGRVESACTFCLLQMMRSSSIVQQKKREREINKKAAVFSAAIVCMVSANENCHHGHTHAYRQTDKWQKEFAFAFVTITLCSHCSWPAGWCW